VPDHRCKTSSKGIGAYVPTGITDPDMSKDFVSPIDLELRHREWLGWHKLGPGVASDSVPSCTRSLPARLSPSGSPSRPTQRDEYVFLPYSPDVIAGTNHIQPRGVQGGRFRGIRAPRVSEADDLTVGKLTHRFLGQRGQDLRASRRGRRAPACPPWEKIGCADGSGGQ
jgi:hypothetical protein